MLLDAVSFSGVDKAVSKATKDLQLLIDLVEREHTAVRGEVPAVEIGGESSASWALQLDAIGLPVCLQGLRLIVFSK